MTRNTKIGIAVIASGFLIAAMAYGSSRVSHEPPPTKDEAMVVADTMLKAFNEADYDTFSELFALNLLDDMSRAAFLEWREPLIEETGNYLSITTIKKATATNPDATRYVLHAAFENDSSVQLAIVFSPGTHLINRVELKPDK